MTDNLGVPKRRKITKTGSPDPGEPVYITVGKLRRSHGIDGEILMDLLTDYPERLRARKTVFVGEDHQPVVIKSVRRADKQMLVRLEGVTTPEEANHYRNFYMFVRADQLPKLPEGEYYHHQLLNLRVEDEQGNELGFLVEIITTGANDVYVVKSSEGSDLLLPAIESVIRSVDLEQKRMIVAPPEWL